MNNRSLSLGILVAMLAIFANQTNAQHSLQVDDGAGNIGIITGPTSGGISMFTLPSTPGTLITTGTTATNPWLLQGNSLSALGASPTQWFGTFTNDDVIMKAGNVVKLRLVSGGGVVIPGNALSINGIAYTFPAAAPNGVLTNTGGVLSWAAAGGDLSPAVILAPTTSTRNVVQPTLATVVPLTVKGFASQSANLQEWTNSFGGVIASVSPSGAGYFDGGLTAYFGATLYGGTTLYASAGNSSTLDVSNITAGGGISGGIYVNVPNGTTAGNTNYGISLNVGSAGGPGTSNDIMGTANSWRITSAGALTLNPLTASSLVATNASKTLVSVANGTGVLTNNGSGTLTWAAAGGLVNFTESLKTTAPYSATDAAARLLATNATATNIAVVLQPKGNGALQAQLADNTTTGGNKRGTYAVDWQMSRNLNTQVAGGIYATVGGGSNNTAGNQYGTVSGGYNNTVNGTYGTVGGGFNSTVNGNHATVAGGYQNLAFGAGAFVGGGGRDAAWLGSNTASGDASVICGGNFNSASGSFAVIVGGGGNTNYDSFLGNSASGFASFIGAGYKNTVTGNYSVIVGGETNTANGLTSTIGGGKLNIVSSGADYSTISGGIEAQANNYGQVVNASGKFTVAGDAQTSVFVLRNQSTAAAATTLFLNGSTLRIAIPTNGAMTFKVTIIGKETGGALGNGNVGGWEIIGTIANNGGAALIIGANVTRTLNAPGTWGAAPTVGVNGANMDIQVNGKLATNINWVARVETVEVIF